MADDEIILSDEMQDRIIRRCLTALQRAGVDVRQLLKEDDKAEVDHVDNRLHRRGYL